ncbi:SLC13 family permease [Fluoribacter gormanii]|uniref:Inner membrane protein YbiR n=1 Tax=Fluoribacter gormanii TaxID=464 RepID=A0A377GFH8_9GAMM|nr:SLC13 family permease [Fluoribacter gormanii]KTD00589.1 arsenite efflux membrane component-like protein [Fluoribacter gormanii]MCW8470299.1 SLC13 family permease [Fluoribacter gormanii]SIR83353.1 transporter, YbiR family [Fluoribacter gormanii]STO23344.1 Inner membrane protein YbiR [Fluoribacter gormanii]
MPVAIWILSITLLGIAIRQITPVFIPIWLITTAGATAALLLNQISPQHAIAAIEPDVMLYLFGVFLIAQAAEDSGYLEQLTDKLFYHANTGKQALFIILFVLGLSSSLLMNDTIAIIGTPIIIQLCQSHKKLIKPLLFALAFSVTIGSALSPIGNPQNLLIAVQGEMPSPFLQFIKLLAIPTLINLAVTYLFICHFYGTILDEPIEKPIPSPVNDAHTVILVQLSLIILFLFIIVKIMLDCIQSSIHLNFSYMALVSSLPLLLSTYRKKFITRLDWGTLAFFASTFVLMQSVWDSGFFQTSINHFHLSITQVPVILIISIMLSQFISNVPMVALYLPLLMQHPVSDSSLLALAAGSTIAGNLSILGAASNIIIIQNCEKRGIRGFDFLEFIKTGAPLTLANILIYAYFL